MIAVVAFLSGMLLPALIKARSKALSAVCVSNLKQWGLVWAFYSYENQDRFSNGHILWARGSWVVALAHHYNEKPRLLLCPDARHRRAPGNSRSEAKLPIDTPPGLASVYGGPHTAYDFPNYDPGVGDRFDQSWRTSSYSCNSWIYDPLPRVGSIQGRAAADHWRSFGATGRHPQAEIPLFLDSMYRGGGPDHRRVVGDMAPTYNGQWLGYGYESAHFAIARHGQGINIVFFDLHVESTTSPRDIWTFQWHRQYMKAPQDRSKTFPDWMN